MGDGADKGPKRNPPLLRQGRRLIVAYKLEGAAVLVSKKRGRPGNRRKSADVKE